MAYHKSLAIQQQILGSYQSGPPVVAMWAPSVAIWMASRVGAPPQIIYFPDET